MACKVMSGIFPYLFVSFLAAGMLFGPPMLGLLADFTKVRWAFVADAAVLAVTAMLFAALAGEPGRGLYLPPGDAAAAAAAGSGRRTVPASAQLHEQRVAQAPMDALNARPCS